jgi:peroxiredoxin Q/BCP
MLTIGDKAPDFNLNDQNGNPHSLRAYAGKWIVLYFYPKDDTPGCTKEACSFRDNLTTITAKSAVVLGISADSTASHEKFASKYDLPFALLADTEKAVVQAFGVWKEKTSYGRTSMGIERTTFLIDPSGTIAHIWNAVKVDGHTEQVLAALPQ